MNAAVTFTPSLPRLTLPTAILPQLVYVEMLLGLAILSPLPLVSIPIFPATTDDPQALKDALGDFILGADGDALWGAPN